MDDPLILPLGGNTVSKIIVIRDADMDGSLFQTVVNALKDKLSGTHHSQGRKSP